MVRAVLFDVDFTLARPGPELGPDGYRRAGERHGLVLDPDRYEAARLNALASLQRHPELEHDDELWVAFTERIVRGMGGDGDAARQCAIDLVRAWERHDRFTLYEDALPVLAELRGHGLKLGLVSNAFDPGWLLHRDLEHMGLAERLDFSVFSSEVGVRKPHPAIFERALEALEVEPERALFVGDRLYEDVRGAAEVGMTTVQALWFRADEHPDGAEPDHQAFTQLDVLNIARRLVAA